MGLHATLSLYARHRDASRRKYDPRHAPPQRPCRWHGYTSLILAGWASLAAPSVNAETYRVAFFATELSRDGPGLLLRDILRDDPQVLAVAQTIATAQADAIVLTGIDYDLGGTALAALAEQIETAGWAYPYHFSLQPNTGRPTGLDLNRDGRTHRAADAQGWGLFSGQNGLAILSRLPIETEAVRDLSTVLWSEIPNTVLPVTDAGPYYSEAAIAVLRLSSVAHWDVPIALSDGASLSLLAFAATPPVFDGPEDRNGLRNAAQITLWQHYLDGHFGPPPDHAVVLGTANLDPIDGEGRHAAIQSLLADPRLQDPAPRSPGAAATANQNHIGDPAQDTVDWWEEENGPGNLRVDYALPTSSLTVIDTGVLWSAPGTETAQREATASRHRLVWVDVALP